ncbi:hypothetical protein SAY87_028134 [Trapa incisa]|uniref:Uncharacterized protein n=1 Tax=Trapa incisa TaxID=236973 RepID=A0AAN7KUB9_9MYRT|nr:hypothetical protein SAY87_028134 [Trapa incisa]
MKDSLVSAKDSGHSSHWKADDQSILPSIKCIIFASIRSTSAIRSLAADEADLKGLVGSLTFPLTAAPRISSAESPWKGGTPRISRYQPSRHTPHVAHDALDRYPRRRQRSRPGIRQLHDTTGVEEQVLRLDVSPSVQRRPCGSARQPADAASCISPPGKTPWTKRS